MRRSAGLVGHRSLHASNVARTRPGTGAGGRVGHEAGQDPQCLLTELGAAQHQLHVQRPNVGAVTHAEERVDLRKRTLQLHFDL